MTAPTVRAGIMGFGLAGRIFHAPFLSAAGFEIGAVSTADPVRAAQARAEYPAVDVVASAEELIGREDLDLLVVATPNSSHVSLAVGALHAGHDVVVDKPFAPSVADAERITAAADETGGVLSVFQSRRYDSDFRTLRRVIDQAELGTVFRFESRFERWRPALSGNWRESGDATEAGGLLFDLGSHLIDQFIVLFGTPDAVYAESNARRPGSDTDDDTFVALHRREVIGHLWMSSVAGDRGPRFRVQGSSAAFVKDGMDPQEEALLAGRRPPDTAGLPQSGWGVEHESHYGRIGAGESWQTVPSERGDYAAFYRQFALAMNSEGDVPVDPAESIAGLRVIEAARRSARHGVVERLS
jgi:scyllo-inositol 2-dehydrogenase (NADP+)